MNGKKAKGVRLVIKRLYGLSTTKPVNWPKEVRSQYKKMKRRYTRSITT